MQYFSEDGTARRRYRRRAVLRRFNNFKKKVAIGIVIVFAFGALIIFGSRLERTRISSIELAGTHTVASSALFAIISEKIAGTYALMIPKNSLFIYPREDIEHSILETYPSVKTVATKIQSFKNLVVFVTEREQYALWCVENDKETASSSPRREMCYGMDNEGFIFNDSQTITEDDTRVIINGALSQQEANSTAIGNQFPQIHIMALESIRERLSVAGIDIKRFIVLTEGDYAIETRQGVRIMWSPPMNANQLSEKLYTALKVDNLKELLDTGSIDYIDLRFNGKVFYK